MNKQQVKSADLANLVARLNRLTGHIGAWNEVGAYTLDWAYGGVSLHQVTNEGGAERDVLDMGHPSKAACYLMIRAYIAGFEDGRNGE